jgi:hypothetical protein
MVQKVLSALMVYTGITLPALSERQERKYREAITGPAEAVSNKVIKEFFYAPFENLSSILDPIKDYKDLSENDFCFAGLGTGKPIGLTSNRGLPPDKWVASFMDGLSQETGPWEVLDALERHLFLPGKLP